MATKEELLKDKVPARYIGHAVRLLPAKNGPYFDGDGNPLQPTIKDAVTGENAYGIRPGDTLMINASELHGQTYLHDRNQNEPSEYIGTGHVVKPEHQGKSRHELTTIGVDGHWVYDFHEGRSDFEPYTPQTSVEAPEKVSQSQTTNTPPIVPVTPVAPVANDTEQ